MHDPDALPDDLAEVARAWPQLDPAIKAVATALVSTATRAGKHE